MAPGGGRPTHGVARINGAAAGVGGLVSTIPVADRGEPAGKPDRVGEDCPEISGYNVGNHGRDAAT